MRIGMIAMSGIRAADEELMALGLTLPGIVERSRVIASMPSLSLLTLAALTPPEFDVEYHEIAELRKLRALPNGFDLVAISSYTAQIADAYQVADRYRACGVPVVMGGLHVTMLPDEAAQHCTAVAVGEGEIVWPRILSDFAAGRLHPRYSPEQGERFNLADSPIPRFDLLDVEKYNRLPVQTSRGCPHLCDFCASSVLLTPAYTVKPVERVLAEVRRVKEIWARPFIEFADDNSLVFRDHYRRLLIALKEENVSWFTEADISIADDPDLLALMRASGCRQVLIGLESPRATGVDGVELKRNWKLKRQPDYEKAVRAIQQHGISVNGCFILGLDGDTPEVFDAIYEFAERTSLYEVQLTILTPFPGTPLYERLKREGRLLEDGAWHKCTLFDVNFVPRRMSAVELRSGMIELARWIYDPAFARRRREGFIKARNRHGLQPAPNP